MEGWHSGIADPCHPRHRKREGPTSEAQWEGSRSDGPQNRGLPPRNCPSNTCNFTKRSRKRKTFLDILPFYDLLVYVCGLTFRLEVGHSSVKDAV